MLTRSDIHHEGSVEPRVGGGGRRAEAWWRAGTRRRAVLAGVLAAAALGVGAPGAGAAVTVKIAVDYNMYPLLRSLAGELQGTYALNTLTSDAAGEVGGFWNNDGDTWLLRGISSGNAARQIVGPGPYGNPSCDPASSTVCMNGPLAVDGFWSASESWVDYVTPNGTNGGTCVTNMAATNRVSICPGSGLKAPVAIGYLAIYRCTSAWNGAGTGDDPGVAGAPVGAVAGSGTGAPGSPRCRTPASGIVTTTALPANATISQLITWLGASTSNVLSIADPAATPYGAAARAALIENGFTYTLGGNVRPAADCDSANNSVPGTCKVRLEAGAMQVRGAVTSSSAQVGLVAQGNIKSVDWTSGSLSPGDDDPNRWTFVAESEYDSTLPGQIKQFATAIGTVNHGSSPRTPADAVDQVINGGSDAGGPSNTDPWCVNTVVGQQLTVFGYGAPDCP